MLTQTYAQLQSENTELKKKIKALETLNSEFTERSLT